MTNRGSRIARQASRPRSVARAVTLSLAVLTLLAAHGTGPLAAQSTLRSTGASAAASLVVSPVAGDASLLGQGGVLLEITPRFRLGGTGTLLLGTKALAGSVPGSDLVLRMAYGGLVGEWSLSDVPGRALSLRLMVGAGNAKVDLAVVGTRIAADNFGVVAPEVVGRLRVAGPLHAMTAIGYRAAFGVEDLPGVRAQDLRGPSVRLGVALLHH